MDCGGEVDVDGFYFLFLFYYYYELVSSSSSLSSMTSAILATSSANDSLLSNVRKGEKEFVVVTTALAFC